MRERRCLQASARAWRVHLQTMCCVVLWCDCIGYGAVRALPRIAGYVDGARSALWRGRPLESRCTRSGRVMSYARFVFASGGLHSSMHKFPPGRGHLAQVTARATRAASASAHNRAEGVRPGCRRPAPRQQRTPSFCLLPSLLPSFRRWHAGRVPSIKRILYCTPAFFIARRSP